MTHKISDLVLELESSRRSAGYSEHTIERIALTMNMVCRDMHVNNLEDLTTKLFIEWGDMKRSGVFGRPLSQSGLYANYNSIRSFLKFVKEDLGIKHQINTKRLFCKPDYERRECLRPEEIRKITAKAPYDIEVLIRLLYTAGMRISEALNLTVDDLRYDYTINIDHSKWCESRTVLITAELHSELKWLVGDNVYIFRDLKDPSEPMKRKNAYYFIKRAMIKAGFPKAYPHALRHGFATTLLRQGADISHVRRLMGHKNILTTQIYEHLVVDDLRATHMQYLVKI